MNPRSMRSFQRHTQRPSADQRPHEAMAWFDESGELVAIGRVDELAVGRVLRGMNPNRHVT